MQMSLYAFLISNLMTILASLSWSRADGTRGRGYPYITVTEFNPIWEYSLLFLSALYPCSMTGEREAGCKPKGTSWNKVTFFPGNHGPMGGYLQSAQNDGVLWRLGDHEQKWTKWFPHAFHLSTSGGRCCTVWLFFFSHWWTICTVKDPLSDTNRIFNILIIVSSTHFPAAPGSMSAGWVLCIKTRTAELTLSALL